MRQVRTMSGRIEPDEKIIDQVREIVNEYWDRASVVEHHDFVEVHMLEAWGSKLALKENTIEDLEEEGFDVDEHSGKWKINVRLPEGDDEQ